LGGEHIYYHMPQQLCNLNRGLPVTKNYQLCLNFYLECYLKKLRRENKTSPDFQSKYLLVTEFHFDTILCSDTDLLNVQMGCI